MPHTWRQAVGELEQSQAGDGASDMVAKAQALKQLRYQVPPPPVYRPLLGREGGVS